MTEIYRKKTKQPMEEYQDGMDLPSNISISEEDKKNGSPKEGDMIAYNPDNPNDCWLVAKDFFDKNYEKEPAEDSCVFDFTTDDDPCNSINREIIANKHLRVGLDDILQNVKSCPSSRERSLAITKIQEAIMWLGMDLKRLNEPNPYPDSYNPENTDIAPTADGLKL